MSQKNNSLATTVAFVSLTIFLVACSDGGNNSTQPMEQKQVSVTVEAIEDLPNCTETREGEYALVSEDSSTYKCENGKWEFVSAPTPTVETLDDLSNCSAKIEGDTVKVNSESAMFRCEDGKWEKYRVVVDTLMNIDDVLACVAKREGNESYIAGEHALYVCEDGAWQKKVTFMDTTTSQETLPNCTSKLEGDSTYLSNEKSVYLCIDDAWRFLGFVISNSDDLPNCTESREGGKTFVANERIALTCRSGKWYSYDIYKDFENATKISSSSQENKNIWEEYDPTSSSSETQSVPTISSSDQQAPVIISTGSSYNATANTLKDFRDGQTYKTVTIGTQIWMAENLNYATDNSYCYGGENANCDAYGRLYKYGEATSVCPTDWHLPTKQELATLVSKAGGEANAGKKLKSSSGWNYGGNGTNDFGFNVLPAGYKHSNGTYEFAGLGADFWSSTYSGGQVCFMDLDYDSDASYVYCNIDPAEYILSIRCIYDEEAVVTTGSIYNASTNTLKDFRDGQTYKTVTIGTQIWMAENLNYATDNSYCYGGENANCDAYGRLYKYGEATYVCPTDWHLPTKQELATLVSKAGGEANAGKKLKSSSGWNYGGNGTNDFGFNVLPAGYKHSNGTYESVGLGADFWSSTYSGEQVCFLDLDYDSDASYVYCNLDPKFVLSIRCIKD